MATTHVFIVDTNTFKYHLEYMFAGTGAKGYDIDFNNSATTNKYSGKLSKIEDNIVSMMADINRIRIGDNIIFYLQQDLTKKVKEGKFYGIFKVKERVGFLDHNDSKQFLASSLQKSLTFRVLIEPYEIYSKGVTEWEALDDISNIKSPIQMQWSLIYRKLKGSRGNTMITIYEFDNLSQLIKNKNNNIPLKASNFTFDTNIQEIINSNQSNQYLGRKENINILPRLINKYSNKLQFETHLQAFILQNIENISIFKNENIEWIGNEVSCGVGMQRIDIMVSSIRKADRIIIPIELKSKEAYLNITSQVQRYVDWLKIYYLSNIESKIEPMIISKKIMNKKTQIYIDLIQEFKKFNQLNYLKLRYVEFDIDLKTSSINFNEIKY